MSPDAKLLAFGTDSYNIDATTFQMYINAMRSVIYEQLKYSDTIICNRCTPDTSASMLRGNIKAINKKAQIFYEGEHGAQVTLKEGVLPFNINAPIIDIKDDDYGIWYMDAIENPDKYDGKRKSSYAGSSPRHYQAIIRPLSWADKQWYAVQMTQVFVD